MRPYLLQGHERPLTQIKFNREGDIFVSCAKNAQPCLWWAEDGKRIGTYIGHNGVVWTCDISDDSERLYTASADNTVKIWDLPTGNVIYSFEHREPCRSVKLSVGEEYLASSSDSFMGTPPRIMIYKLSKDVSEQSSVPLITIDVPNTKITRIFWTEGNTQLITSHDLGFVRKWDVETGKMLLEKQIHEETIQDMQLSADGTHAITASLDRTAKLIDVETLDVIKTYKAGRYVQSAAMSPIFDHVILGGGQDASQVTTTAAQAGGFESRFFHKIYQEEFGRVRGHFGPINTIAFSPNGKSFVTGGEDGYIRLHHFDMDYFTTKFF